MIAVVTEIKSTLTELCFQDLNYDKLCKFFHTLEPAQVGLSRDNTENGPPVLLETVLKSGAASHFPKFTSTCGPQSKSGNL